MKTNEVVRYISMEEFAKTSGVKESTIKKRYQDIPGITKEGSSFTILSGTRYPCDKRRIKPKDSGDRRYLLLKTISEYRYISHEHLLLEEKQFDEMLVEFLQAGLAKFGKSPCFWGKTDIKIPTLADTFVSNKGRYYGIYYTI